MRLRYDRGSRPGAAILSLHAQLPRPARARHAARLGGACLLAVVLAGCIGPIAPVGPDHVAPAPALPPVWSVREDSGTARVDDFGPDTLVRWWEQLRDPALSRLIDAALAANPDLRAARARVQQARALRAQAAGGLFPSMSASTAAIRNRPAGALTTSGTLHDVGFDAAWEIDLFGGTQRAIEAAGASLEASRFNLEATRVSLAAEVALSHVDAIAYQRRLEIARANLASQTETLRIVEWRHQAGLAAGSDVDQARTAREQTRATLPDLESARVAALNRLAVLLGRNPGELADLAPQGAELPPLPASVATGIPADVLRRRPDLRAAERTLAAETARVGQTLARRFPSLNLGASFGWQAYSVGALGAAGTLARAASGTLAVTLFDGGRLRSAVEAQSAVQEQALIAYERAVLTALEEVENALFTYAAGRERVDARRAAAEAARSAARLTRDLYEAGLTDFPRVLETGRTLLAAEDALAQAEAAMRTSLIRLFKALGGGWDERAPTLADRRTEPGKP